MKKTWFEKIKSNTVVLMSVIVICKLIGMLRDIVLADCYGTSSVSDAYLIATAIPVYLFYFIGHSLGTAYLPIFNRILKKEGKNQAYKYTHELIGASLLLCVAIVVCLICFPKWFVGIFANGFDDQTTAITARMIRYCAIDLFLMVLINVWGSFLQAHNNFIIPASVSLPRNIIIIVSIYISTIVGVDFLGVGIVLAYMSEALLLLPFTIGEGLHPKLQVNIQSPSVKETVYFALPVVVGVSVNQVNSIIDRSMASNITVGGVSALNYASVINNAVQEIIVTGIVMILFAKCAALVAEGRINLVKEKLNRTIDTLSFFLIPAVFGVLACSQSIVQVVLCRGAFDEFSLKLTNGCLIFYTVGLPFFALRDVISKVFYSLKDSKTPTITSIGSVSLNVGLNFLFSHFWSIKGLALASSISALVHSILLYFLLRMRIGDYGSRDTLISVVKSTIAAIVMYFIVVLLNSFLVETNLSSLLILLISIFLGMIVYCVLSLMLKNKTVLFLKSYVSSRIKLR